MNLDDLSVIKQIDSQNMLGEIDSLPAQLESAWKLGQTLPLPKVTGIKQVLLSGMGGSAIGADLLASYSAASCPIPVVVHRDYGLPAWAEGSGTMVIASSHSGETEETLDSFEAAKKAGCQILVVCTGGKLEKHASVVGIPVWKFNHSGQPRAAVGWSFGLLASTFSRLGFIPGVAEELPTAVAAMRSQQEMLNVHVPVVNNPAKRMAGQLVDRWVNVYGAGILAAVARRWKTQINEIAKAGAGFEFLPEADHNALAGVIHPELLMQTMTIFLDAVTNHPRNRLRTKKTRQVFLTSGLNTEYVNAEGDSALAQMWTTLHYGDYTAYYLAMAYGIDPTPVNTLQEFKAALQ